MKEKKEFMEGLYITCEHCGYNNLKNRFENYGTCLRCKKVLDRKTYFKAQLGKIARRSPRARTRRTNRAVLYF